MLNIYVCILLYEILIMGFINGIPHITTQTWSVKDVPKNKPVIRWST